MMLKIFIDPGHGGSDPGAAANGLQEKNITLKIATRIRDILALEYEGLAVKLSRSHRFRLSHSKLARMRLIIGEQIISFLFM